MMSTQFTRYDGAAAVVGAAFWIASAALGAIGQGNLFTEWTDRNYSIWSSVTAIAVICSFVALTGALYRTGGRGQTATVVVLAVAIVGVVLMVIGTWAWFATALPIAVSFAWLIFRMRAGGFARPVHWLLVAAWPVGMAVLVLLDQLEVGPQDTYGDHSVASVAGFAVAASLFAIGLASLGQWLRTSRPVARDPELAGM